MHMMDFMGKLAVIGKQISGTFTIEALEGPHGEPMPALAFQSKDKPSEFVAFCISWQDTILDAQEFVRKREPQSDLIDFIREQAILQGNLYRRRAA